MKHKHAENIMQFAKMLVAGHPADDLVKCKSGNKWLFTIYPIWVEANEYKVAIAFLDGLPVFEGDTLYVNGTKCTAEMKNGYVCFMYDGDIILALGDDYTNEGDLSWLPDQPAHIKELEAQVELLTKWQDDALKVMEGCSKLLGDYHE